LQVPGKVVRACLGSNSLILQTSRGEIWVSGLNIWTLPTKFVCATNAEEIFCGEDYFAVLGSDKRVHYFGGQFDGAGSMYSDWPDELYATAPAFFPGIPLRLVGKYSYMTALIED
jgi:hypothetical protein